jgi:hypothetical protein
MDDTAEDKSLKALPGKVAQLRRELRDLDLQELRRGTGSEYTEEAPGKGVFRLPMWGREVIVEAPSFTARIGETGSELSIDQQALLLFYFRHAQGGGPDGRLVSFSELPGGRFYNAAFQGYSGNALAQAFKADRAAFERAAEKLEGEPVPLGEAAYTFRVLPRVVLGVVYWEGDEDFPASMQVLFDTAAVRHLPVDVCAIMGGMLARRLIKAGKD